MALTRRGLFALDFGRQAADDQWLRVHRKAMACRFEVTLPRDAGVHVPAAARALDEADRVEALLSVFREDTEVSRVNRVAAADAVRVSRELFALLRRCEQLHEATEGAFDVTSTALSRCWGFLKREGRVPDGAALAAARTVVGMSHVRLLDDRRVTFDRDGVGVNFGAIGKGYAVDRMGAVLRGSGTREALVSAGGSSVLALGGRGGGWLVDVRSPRLAGERIARIALLRGALGTSGAGEQFVMADGKRYGHVIDPRTGIPARGVLSSTVVARDAATADALSTAFLIGGPDLARRYCETHESTMALLVLEEDADGRYLFGRFRGARIEA